MNLVDSMSIRHSRMRGCAGDYRLLAYSVGLGIAAMGTALALLASGARFSNPWVIAILALAAAAAERGTVQIAPSIEVSIGLLPTLFAAVVFGPLAAMSIAAASMLGDLRRHIDVPLPHLRWIVYTCTRALTGAAAGLIAAYGRGVVSSDIAALAFATLLGAVALELLDVFFFSLTMTLRRKDTRQALRAVVPVKLSALPLFAPIVGLLAFTYDQISPWTLPLFFAPAFAAQRLSILYQEQRRLTEDVVSVNRRLEQANLSFATALVATLDARDRYTAGHSTAVARYASDIARRLGLRGEEQQLVSLCGLVHDIGKVGLPVGLLEKPGPLTQAERRQMEKHSAIGQMILAKVDDYADIALIVRHHHERVDGRGYPDGLTGDEIPLASRIIAVADAYDAMTSDRPYRDAMPSRVARLRLVQAAGTQFDTSVVAAFEWTLANQGDASDTAADNLPCDARDSFRMAV